MKLKEKIIELRLKGYSYSEIKDELGCAKSSISYHCKNIDDMSIKIKNTIIKNKKQEKNKSFLIEDIDISNVIKLRKDNSSYEEIKKETGYSITVISKVCREYDLLNNIKNVDNNLINEINFLYKKYNSTIKVANELNISKKTVTKYLNDENMKILKSKRIKKISASKSVIDWRRRTKIKLVEYKGGECVRCGYKKSLGALELHHLDPNEKDFTISGKSWSFERLKLEADKCILVCSNCHIEIHEEIRERNVAQSVER